MPLESNCSMACAHRQGQGSYFFRRSRGLPTLQGSSFRLVIHPAGKRDQCSPSPPSQFVRSNNCSSSWVLLLFYCFCFFNVFLKKNPTLFHEVKCSYCCWPHTQVNGEFWQKHVNVLSLQMIQDWKDYPLPGGAFDYTQKTVRVCVDPWLSKRENLCLPLRRWCGSTWTYTLIWVT